MKITFHGHSCVSIELSDKTRLIIDPFITGNPLTDLNADEVEVDYILLTHGHNDHVGDTETIAQNNDAIIIANVELADYFSDQGFETHGLNIGGGFNFPFGYVKNTIAYHSSSYVVDGERIPMGVAGGFLIKAEGKIVYHAGDTALFSDMRMYAEEGRIDVAFLPIGDNFTMGPRDALKACHYLQPRKMVPMHYNTFDLIKQDPHKLKEHLPKVVYVMDPGQSLDL
ncbi:MAG TPA: metal-dependent hydrolase [Erysipelothrix sp.]|jgi:L-ascorbate metabolism protein UlaG (beta-lactamase superfamily)|nr:metal-dependent hydrolase [Erysipelothrix sp.]